MQKWCKDGNFQASHIKIRSKSILNYDFCFCLWWWWLSLVCCYPLSIRYTVYNMHKWWWCVHKMRCAQFSLKGIQKKQRERERKEKHQEDEAERTSAPLRSRIAYCMPHFASRYELHSVLIYPVCNMQGAYTDDRTWKLYYKFIEDNE